MKLNKERREFYLELNDILNDTSLTETDLRDKFGTEFEKVIERDISGIVNRFIHYAYTGKNQKAHRLMLLYILLTEPEAREGFKKAIIEQTKAAYYSGMDLNAYQEEQKESIPHPVYYELVNADLFRPGEVDFNKDFITKIENKVAELITEW
jgi:hypothetical protein